MTRGVLAGTAGMLWLRLTSFVAVPLLVGELGLSLYGVWAITDVLIAGQGVIDLGVLHATVKFVADADTDDDPATARRVIRYSLTWYTVLNLAVAGAVLAVIGPMPGWLGVPASQVSDARVLLVGGAVAFAISNYSYVFGHALLGMQDATTLNFVYAVSRLPYLAILGITIAADWGAVGVAAATAVMYLIQAVWLAIVIRRRLPTSHTDAEPTVTVRDLVRFGSRTYVAALADFIVLQAPKLVATRIDGAAGAGRYDLASRIPLVAASASYPLQGPTMAAAARLTRQDRSDDTSALLARVTRYLMLFMVPLFAAILVAGPAALRLWVGEDGAGLASTLRWLVPGLLISAILTGTVAVLTGSGSPGMVARYKVVLLLATLGFMVGAGTQWGLPGISGGLSVAAFVAAIYLGILMHRELGPGPLAGMARVAVRPIAAIAFAGALTALALIAGANVWVATVLLVVVYLVLAVAMRIVTRDDISLVRSALQGPAAPTDPLGVEV